MKWIRTKLESFILSGNLFYLFFFIISINLLFIINFLSNSSNDEILNFSLKGKNSFYIPINLIKYQKSISKQQIKEMKNESLTKTESNSMQVGSEGQLKDSYIARILQKIEKNKRYPKIELLMERQGYVKVHLQLSRNGQILHLYVIEGTNENFINEVLRTIHQSAPFEPIPQELGDPLSILLNIKFVLE